MALNDRSGVVVPGLINRTSVGYCQPRGQEAAGRHSVLLVAVLAGVNLTVARVSADARRGRVVYLLRDKDIHYIEQSGTGPLVVLIHGLPGTAERISRR